MDWTIRCLAACLALAGGLAFAQAQPPPAAAFASLPEMSFVRLSPDGQKLAWANDPGGTPVVVIFDLATGRDLQRLTPANARVRDLDWADDQTLIMSISRSLTLAATTTAEQRYEFWRYLAVDAAGGKARSLLMEHPAREAVTGAYLERLHVGKPETVIMSTYNYSETARRPEIGSRISGGRKDEGFELSLFEVNTRNGNGRMIESGSPFTDDWIVDAAGQAVVRSEWHPDTRIYSVLVKEGGGWRTAYSARMDYEFSLAGLSADGRSLLALSARGGDKFKVWAIPVAGGEMTVYYEHPDYDVTAIVHDRYSGSPSGFSIGGPEPFVHWIDPKLDAIQKAVGKAFPGHQCAIFDRSRDYKRIVARVESPSSAPVYYLIDFAKGTADIIGESYPALGEAQLGTLAFMSYSSFDGTSIPAYLTLPPGREPKRLPLVVFPHGGPYARDDTEFDWWSQFLATRGYAVLQPQFRGSRGFGAPLFRAGHRQWGRGMQDDISAGVRHLAEKGIADPARVCIVGASYGGYAALAGAAFTPDLYACAVSVNGIADIPNMVGFIRKQHGEGSDALQAWKDLIGNPSDEDLARFSPARSLETIQDPILLLHATNDTIVPFSQSETFARLLAQHGKRYELVRLEGEDHWLSTSSSRLKLLQALESFLGTCLRPAAPGP
jgi:dipeptidyl aminopeptidase/acylaminoacyl peptidase